MRFSRCVWGMCLVGLTLTACSRSDRGLERRIGAEARGNAGSLIRVASLTEFSWERLHVFGPYTSQETIDGELGFRWPAAAQTGIFDSDAIALLVFVEDGEVVGHVAHPRSEGDFADVKTPGGLLPEEAVFIVRVDERGRRILQLAQDRKRLETFVMQPPRVKRSTAAGREIRVREPEAPTR